MCGSRIHTNFYRVFRLRDNRKEVSRAYLRVPRVKRTVLIVERSKKTCNLMKPRRL
jgi:hypothetical protein